MDLGIDEFADQADEFVTNTIAMIKRIDAIKEKPEFRHIFKKTLDVSPYEAFMKTSPDNRRCQFINELVRALES